MKRNSAINFWLAPIAFALIFVGYLSVWLPNKVAGLAMLGLEIGEWVKFLPGMRWDAVNNPDPLVDRNWFYLPPIMLSAALLLWSTRWRSSGWLWLVRLLALAAATLALPAIPDILNHPRESLPRMSWVVACGVVFLLVSVVGDKFGRIPPILITILGLIGAILPTWAYFAMIPIISDYTRETPGVGYGVWLSLVGHIGLIVLGLFLFRQQKSDA